MPWLTTHDATNKIVLTERIENETYNNPYMSWTRSISTEQYEHVGMAEAAADACLTALNDPANGVIAVKHREGAGGNYKVTVTETTIGTWVV